MWGTIAPYIGSYYHHLDSSVYVSDFILVSLISYISETCFTMVACYLIRCMTPLRILISGIVIFSAGLFGSSYITEPYLFMWVFGISLGALSSSIYLPSLWILWNEIPEHKARTSGIILAGYSFGPVPFNILFTMIANPYNYPAETIHKDGYEKEQIFGDYVSYRVPMTIRWMTLAIIIWSTIGILCLPKKWKNDVSPASNRKPTISFCDMIKSKKAWNLFLMLFSGHSTVSYMYSVYKIIGIQYVGDDHFVSFTGSVSFFISCFGRIMFGLLFDRYYWKRIMVVSYILTILFLIIFGMCADNRYLYLVCVVFISFLGTSVYSSVLIQSDKDFPYDKWVLSYICLAFIPNYALPYVFEKWITPMIGYFACFCILSGLTTITIFQVIFHPDSSSSININQSKTDKLVI